MIYLGKNEIYDMKDDQVKDFIRKVEKGLISQILDINGDYILFIEHDEYDNKYLIAHREFSEKKDLEMFKLKDVE